MKFFKVKDEKSQLLHEKLESIFNTVMLILAALLLGGGLGLMNYIINR
jgi:hypothetical protein